MAVDTIMGTKDALKVVILGQSIPIWTIWRIVRHNKLLQGGLNGEVVTA